uniref:Uncharacterized protein n=1 Tax=Solanum lycopersicum TaxID=4081 RepID=A0A3Q7GVM7_SOLLC
MQVQLFVYSCRVFQMYVCIKQAALFPDYVCLPLPCLISTLMIKILSMECDNRYGFVIVNN